MKRSSKAKSLVMFPAAVLLLGFNLLKRLFTSGKTPRQLRSADQAHQSKVRRELRGLPADHDQAAFRAKDDSVETK